MASINFSKKKKKLLWNKILRHFKFGFEIGSYFFILLNSSAHRPKNDRRSFKLHDASAAYRLVNRSNANRPLFNLLIRRIRTSRLRFLFGLYFKNMLLGSIVVYDDNVKPLYSHHTTRTHSYSTLKKYNL